MAQPRWFPFSAWSGAGAWPRSVTYGLLVAVLVWGVVDRLVPAVIAAVAILLVVSWRHPRRHPPPRRSPSVLPLASPAPVRCAAGDTPVVPLAIIVVSPEERAWRVDAVAAAELSLGGRHLPRGAPLSLGVRVPTDPVLASLGDNLLGRWAERDAVVVAELRTHPGGPRLVLRDDRARIALDLDELSVA